MNMTEDEQLKSLLVEIDEVAQEKSRRTEFAPEQRLRDVMRSFEMDLIRSVSQESKSKLAQQLDQDEETRTLQELLEHSRRRQGL